MRQAALIAAVVRAQTAVEVVDEAYRQAVREALSAGLVPALMRATGMSRSTLYRLAAVPGVDRRERDTLG